jgi:hypothetical protein
MLINIFLIHATKLVGTLTSPVAADSVMKIGPHPVETFSPCLLPSPHAANREKYKNRCMSDQAGHSIGVNLSCWWAGPGEVLAYAMSQGRLGRVECLLYLFITVLPPPLPLLAKL